MIAADFFDGRSSRRIPVTVEVSVGVLSVTGEDVARAVPAVAVRVRPRIGRTPLRVELPTDSGLRVDLERAEVWVNGRQVSLGPKEYLALAFLYRRRGALVTKEELAAQVWPEFQGAVSDYNIEQLISRLRRKLEQDPEHPRYVLTVRGLGYRLAAS